LVTLSCGDAAGGACQGGRVRAGRGKRGGAGSAGAREARGRAAEADAYPLVVDEGLAVDVGVEHVLVGAEEVDDGVGLGHEHEALALDVEHALGLEVGGVVLGVLGAPGHALGGGGVVFVDGHGDGVPGVGERGEGVGRAGAGDLLVRDARDLDADGEREAARVLDDAGGLEHGLPEDGDGRLRVAALDVHAEDLLHLAVLRGPARAVGAAVRELAQGAEDARVEAALGRGFGEMLGGGGHAAAMRIYGRGARRG